MENSETVTPLFSHFNASNGKQIFTCEAQRTGEGDVTLTFYETCLMEASSKKKQTMNFDFDLKYAFTVANPCTLIFEKQEDRVQYTLKNPKDL